MRDVNKRPTIGVLINWEAYQGTTIRGYQAPLLQGMHAAAVEQDCNLLLACDISQRTYPYQFTNGWPSSDGSAHFLPVGPWNTDGLIVVADALTAEQTAYLSSLVAARHPIVYAGFSGPSTSVVVDNAGGIRLAFEHLLAHGHSQIAFIAGFEHQPGDSRERFQAYCKALRDHDLPFDPCLVAYSQGPVQSGRNAMQEILARNVPFTAVLAHNDSCCKGIIEVVREAGLRIPEDIALIGFDDLVEVRAFTPPLTTIHHPTFTLGGQAIRTMVDVLAGRISESSTFRIPTRLVIRRSCGCRPGVDAEIGDTQALVSPSTQNKQTELMATMVNATLLKTPTADVESACQNLIQSFMTSVQTGDEKQFIDVLIGILRDTEARGEDAYAWQSTLSTLRQGLSVLLPPADVYPFAYELLDRARLVVGERVRRQVTHSFTRYMDAAEVLGLMTSELLAALDEAELSIILAEYLPRIGIRHMVVARFEPHDDDLIGASSLVLSYGLNHSDAGQRFSTYQFPPPGMYPSESAFHLALLPLAGQKEIQGFVAFDAANLEPCAVIARNLAAALRSQHLYLAANEARLRAEEANRLKSRFLSMVSHDLRTPLNLIIGLSEMALREQQSAASSGTLLEDISQISMNAQHLGQLIGDVLDLASSEAGQLRLLREPLNLAEVLKVVALTGEQMARDKGLTWQVSMPPASVWVLGDRTRLRQIALNLVSNAVKFTSQGSIVLEVTVEHGQAKVSVSDTGLGVPLAEQATIFDEFQRGEQTFAHGYDGLGLGLAICKRLVELHDGTIGLHSSGETGSGATFFFTLPTIKEKLLEPEPTTLPATSGQTIVFLTESSKVGSPLETYLAQHGCHISVCCIDTEADWLQQLLHTQPEAILLDAQLALAQGWQILAALERQPVTQHIPLVVCSLDPDTEQGALLEFTYQRKPLDATHLSQILDGQGLLSNDAAKTVMIVDDDPAILHLHTRLLQEQGQFRILQAHNGREALAMFTQNRLDLVLLDLMMPEVDGFGVLEAIRSMEQNRDVPVVVLTAQSLTEADMERLNRGAAAILSKGLFHAEEILEHVNAALMRTRKLGSTTQRLVRKAIAYIHEHSSEPLSRSQIAQYIGITEDYLTNCFHQELGMPPMTYVTRYRIRQARELLETTAQSITDVALSVGFVDSSHFSRVFQREVGVSPNAYRRGKRASA